MSSNFLGLLVILIALTVSINITMAMRNEPLLLAWLNQILLGTILIATLSYIIVSLGTRKATEKSKKHVKEHK